MLSSQSVMQLAQAFDEHRRLQCRFNCKGNGEGNKTASPTRETTETAAPTTQGSEESSWIFPDLSIFKRREQH